MTLLQSSAAVPQSRWLPRRWHRLVPNPRDVFSWVQLRVKVASATRWRSPHAVRVAAWPHVCRSAAGLPAGRWTLYLHSAVVVTSELIDELGLLDVGNLP